MNKFRLERMRMPAGAWEILCQDKTVENIKGKFWVDFKHAAEDFVYRIIDIETNLAVWGEGTDDHSYPQPTEPSRDLMSDEEWRDLSKSPRPEVRNSPAAELQRLLKSKAKKALDAIDAFVDRHGTLQSKKILGKLIKHNGALSGKQYDSNFEYIVARLRDQP